MHDRTASSSFLFKFLVAVALSFAFIVAVVAMTDEQGDTGCGGG